MQVIQLVRAVNIQGILCRLILTSNFSGTVPTTGHATLCRFYKPPPKKCFKILITSSFEVVLPLPALNCFREKRSSIAPVLSSPSINKKDPFLIDNWRIKNTNCLIAFCMEKKWRKQEFTRHSQGECSWLAGNLLYMFISIDSCSTNALRSWDQIQSLCTSFEKCRTCSNSKTDSSLVIQHVLFVKLLWWASYGNLWRFESVQACQTAELSPAYYRVRPEPSIPFRTAVFLHAVSHRF